MMSSYVPPDLCALFSPRAIAVVGASERAGSVGRIIFEGLRRTQRRLFAVHPGARTVLGYPAVASPSELPGEVDLAVVAVGSRPAVAAAEQCAAAGVPYIIVVAGGFAETGPEGAALEARLKAIPQRWPSRILGPNSLGIFVPAERLDTIFVEHGDKALAGGGGIAFVTQSGSVGVEALGLASNTGYGMRAFVGLGNKCDLNELDFLDHFAADRPTRCLAFYLESIDGRPPLFAASPRGDGPQTGGGPQGRPHRRRPERRGEPHRAPGRLGMPWYPAPCTSTASSAPSMTRNSATPPRSWPCTIRHLAAGWPW